MRECIVRHREHSLNSSVIASFFPDIKAKSAKISALEKSGEIIRLRRNLFVLNPDESGVALSVGLTANHLLAPSYVSMQTALRHYGLIPGGGIYGTVDDSQGVERCTTPPSAASLTTTYQRKHIPSDLHRCATATHNT